VIAYFPIPPWVAEDTNAETHLARMCTPCYVRFPPELDPYDGFDFANWLEVSLVLVFPSCLPPQPVDFKRPGWMCLLRTAYLRRSAASTSPVFPVELSECARPFVELNFFFSIPDSILSCHTPLHIVVQFGLSYPVLTCLRSAPPWV